MIGDLKSGDSNLEFRFLIAPRLSWMISTWLSS